MKRKAISTFKVLPIFLLVFLIFNSLLMSGCSPLEIIFGPSGSIDVATYPSGAKIFLNGRDTGYITPHTIPNLIKGTYKIKVTFEDKSYTETVIVYSGCPTSVYKDLFPHLKEIIVNPDFLYTKIGETRNFSTITAYYFDVDHSPEVIKLSDCSYAKDNGHAIINSEKETFTGISKGQTKVTISYTEGEFTEIDLVDIYVNTFPTPPPEPIPDPDPGPEPDEGLSAEIEITEVNQEYYEYLGEWSSLVEIWYKITNTGNLDIDYYKIWFEVICVDGTTYEDWTGGFSVDIGHSISDYTIIVVPKRQAKLVRVTEWELTNYDF